MITIDALTYTYRNRPAPSLQAVSVEFVTGQLALVAGASGSGKSTLARCINGLIPRNYRTGALSGRVLIDGADTRTLSLAALSQHVGTVLQDPEKQIVAADVLGEIAFGLENLALPRPEIVDRVTTAAEHLGISHLLGRNTIDLSGGERQKVAIAGVLAMQPRALLLDEPLASLDPASAREAMQLFRALANNGAAVIIIEHRLRQVLAAQPEQTVLMDAGAIISRAAADIRALAGAAHSAFVKPADSTGESLLELRDVHFSYPNSSRAVLAGISLSVQTGDRIALLGPNGTGKSTLCKHLIGLNRPTRGSVWLNGTDIAGMTVAEIARRVGYVFQSPSYMLFAPTLKEELEFGPGNLKLPRDVIDQNVQRAATAMGLADRLADSPFALSFGGQKRASIASVLAMGTRVLIMDEPTAGQDAETVERFMQDMLHNDQIDALLFATHDLDLVRRYANRVLVMNNGKLLADAAPEAVLADQALLERCRLI